MFGECTPDNHIGFRPFEDNVTVWHKDVGPVTDIYLVEVCRCGQITKKIAVLEGLVWKDLEG